MQRSKNLAKSLIAGIGALLFVGRAFTPTPTLVKGERTDGKEDTKVISDLAAWRRRFFSFFGRNVGIPWYGLVREQEKFWMDNITCGILA
eukprot:s5076_g1.t1